MPGQPALVSSIINSRPSGSGGDAMRNVRLLLVAGIGLALTVASGPVEAQKRGGVLRMYSPDSPASMSIHEEVTVFAQGPMMGVFNNLVIFGRQARHSNLKTNRP
jgi:hypothetical protein